MDKGDMVYFAQELVKLNEMQGWNYELATCAEEIDLEGVIHNHCIDDELIIRLAYQDKVLMDFLKVKSYQCRYPICLVIRKNFLKMQYCCQTICMLRMAVIRIVGSGSFVAA